MNNGTSFAVKPVMHVPANLKVTNSASPGSSVVDASAAENGLGL
jgi:hypothetical protein